ncbi:LysR family transcriptional regulator [Thalassotalea sp. PLHSN55]|uniref:LysR family transcriptional regulator n=1 Tax=Thalassotalea sp. PLHSN55 TaxID=3435888 RepID=UPI003F84D251
MYHEKLDLNLFIVFLNVYEHGSITKAAEKLFITQPAVSHSLGRLREQYQDKLFVRQGKKMIPTELAVTLQPTIKQCVQGLNATLQQQVNFDPTNHERTLKLGMRDIVESLLLPTIGATFTNKYPNFKIESSVIPMHKLSQKLNDGDIDLVIDALLPTAPNIANKKLSEDSFMLLCRKDHPYLEQQTLENYLAARHLLVSPAHSLIKVIDTTLVTLGGSRDIAIKCESYYAGVETVVNSDLLMTMPRAHAKKLAEQFPVEIVELPFETPKLQVHIYWHKRNDQETYIQWFIDQLTELAVPLING